MTNDNILMNDYSRVSSNQIYLICHSAKAYAEATDQVTASYQVALFRALGPVINAQKDGAVQYK